MSVRLAPVSVLVRVIVAPGITAPEGSLTVTFKVANCWPRTLLETRSTSTTTAVDKDEVRFIVISAFLLVPDCSFSGFKRLAIARCVLKPLLLIHA